MDGNVSKEVEMDGHVSKEVESHDKNVIVVENEGGKSNEIENEENIPEGSGTYQGGTVPKVMPQNKKKLELQKKLLKTLELC